jgi:hypothetical protein
MDNETPPPTQRPRKKFSWGSNLLWYGLLGLLGVLFVYSLLDKTTRAELPYGKLIALIEQGAGGRTAAVEVIEGASNRLQRVRYSNLEQVQVGEFEITGTVTRQVVAPKEQPPQRDVWFRTNRAGVANDNGYLVSLLMKHGFTDMDAESPPGFWRDWGPSLLLLAFFVPLFIIMMRRLGGAGGPSPSAVAAVDSMPRKRSG